MYTFLKGLNLVSMSRTGVLLTREEGHLRMPSSQTRAAYQVHLVDDYDGGEDEDDDACGVGVVEDRYNPHRPPRRPSL